MNGAAAKAVRRDLRRAVGESALQIVDGQSTAIEHLVAVSNRSVKRLDALEAAQVVNEKIAHGISRTSDEFIGRTLWQRLKWIACGR